MERISLDQSALQAVDEYCEYRRIVGEDDGGTLFTPQQYEEYKRRVVPRRIQNRLYVSYGVAGGLDCKLIGPETPCFCTHRYKQHQSEYEELPTQRPLVLPCHVHGCPCSQYQYVPQMGSRPVRCRCKHLPEEHEATMGHLCSRCSSCRGFYSPSTCGCGQPYSAHRTLVESRQERQARGAPLGWDVPYAAMGGLTGYSSLMDGYLRLDSSGAGHTGNTCDCTVHLSSVQKPKESTKCSAVSLNNK
uniref:Protein FAM221A n=1 Tax=Periophthalmus magnuspinnatus TaxID=409849 RepID=A0A3B3ZRN8_9GOBI